MKLSVVGKYEKNGVIIEYTVSDGVETKIVKSKELKSLVSSGKVTLSNYKLTSDNRLIPCKVVNDTKDLYYLMNKDEIIGTIDLSKCTLCLNKPLVYNISNIGFWLNDRTRFACARDVKSFFCIIGVQNIRDFISIFHCISLHDTLWVKGYDENISWSKVSPYCNNYSRLISHYSLDGVICGKSAGNYISPDISTNGTFPHTWNYNNGEIIFIKAGSKYTLGGINSGREPYSEYFSSKVCEFLCFNHVKYKIKTHHRSDGNEDIVTECRCFTSEEIGSVSASTLGLHSYKEVIEYCKKLGNDSLKTILDMLFLDCLLLNTDRHFGNIEFLFSNRTQRVLKLAPIYDNNCSLLPRFIEELETFNRKEYTARTGESFESVFSLVKSYKNYRKELIKLKDFRFTKPETVPVSDSRLKFLNRLLQQQVSYWLSK